MLFFDGVVKSQISFVIDFSQNLNKTYCMVGAWKKHYALYIELFDLAIRSCNWPFYEFSFLKISEEWERDLFSDSLLA